MHAQPGLVRDDQVTDTGPVRARYPDFAALIAAREDEALSKALRRAESIARPLGDAAFLDRLEHPVAPLGPQNAVLNRKNSNNCTVTVTSP